MPMGQSRSRFDLHGRPHLSVTSAQLRLLTTDLGGSASARAAFSADPASYLVARGVPADGCELAGPGPVQATTEVCTFLAVCVAVVAVGNIAAAVNAAYAYNVAYSSNWCSTANFGCDVPQSQMPPGGFGLGAPGGLL